MNIYIKELETNDKINKLDRLPNIIKKVVINIIERTNYFFIKEINDNNKIYLIPNIKRKKVYENIKKELKKRETKTQRVQAILSKKVKKYEEYLKPINIVKEKRVLINNIDKVLKMIFGDNKAEFQDIYILTNNYINTNVNIIKKIVTNVKTVNIITNQIEKYSVLEDMLLKEGILINISNNKRKSLKKAKIIINLDFTQEELKKYIINRDAIILNINNEVIDNLKGFDGIIIQNIEIKIEENEKNIFYNNNLINNFSNAELYESIEKQGKTNDENIEILYLCGKNGKIDEKELRNKQKILTNIKN